MLHALITYLAVLEKKQIILLEVVHRSAIFTGAMLGSSWMYTAQWRYVVYITKNSSLVILNPCNGKYFPPSYFLWPFPGSLSDTYLDLSITNPM